MPQEKEYVVYIGGPCIDEYFEINRWPKEGDKYVGRFQGGIPGGMIANAACVMAGYGIETYCFIGLYRDNYLDFLLQDLEANHVKTSQILIEEEGTNGKCLIFQNVADRTICVVPANPPWHIKLSEEQLNFLRGAKYLYTTLANLNDFENPVGLFKDLKEHGVKIVLDNEASTIVDHWEDLMQYCYLSFMNEYAVQLYGNGLSEEELVKKLQDLGVEIVAETLGDKGCKIITKEEIVEVPAYHVNIVDTTGAGDTFNSTFTYGIHAGMSIREAAEFATAAAAMSITKQGGRSGITNVEQVKKFMEMNQGNRGG
ncbi:MAG: carbohydrate kinase family protein [Solobacterium sp.]|nr:carbohydrate kinase family protein [Solobacterium sp.]